MGDVQEINGGAWALSADRRITLLNISLSSFLTPFSGSSFSIALPSISSEFGLDAVAMNWASLAFLLSSAVFLIPFGKLADMHGRKRVYTLGIAVFTLSSALLAACPSSAAIVPLRALQGIGSAMVFGTGVAILVSSSSPAERGSTLGIYSASVYAGLSVGPFLGGYMTQNLGWRSIFVFNVVLGLSIILLTIARMRGEWREDGEKRFDLMGSAAYGAMFFALMYGFSKIPQAESIPPIVLSLLLAACLLYVERRAENPVLDVRLFTGNRAFVLSNLAALVNYSATYSVTFLLSLYLQFLKAMTPQQAGVVMISSPVLQALISPLAGRLSDRVKPASIATIGMAVTTFSLLPFVFLSEGTPVAGVSGSLALLGVGLALFSSPNTNYIMGSVDRRLYGVASSIVGTMRLTGQMLSQGTAMMTFALYLGAEEITQPLFPQLLSSIRACFVIFFFLCTLGVVASSVGRRYSP